MNRTWDVIILGGGPAGVACALSLTRSGLSAMIIESSAYEAPRLGETLPPAIKQLLVDLDVWQSFLDDCHASSPAIQSAWATDELQVQDHIYNPYGPGWHVDRARFDAMLARRAEELGATILTNTELVSWAKDSSGDWQVEISQGGSKNSCEARFFVDASGRSSFFASRQGVKRIAVDRLISITSFFIPTDPESLCESSTLIEAAEDGWWYSAPLPDSRLVLAYMTDGDLYARSQRRNENYLWQQLDKTTHSRLRVGSSYVPTSRPRVVSANSSQLERVSNGNWLAVGDAALAMDPLSGQGVYRALNSGRLGAGAIQKYFAGEKAALADYDVAIKRAFAHYLLIRERFYAEEKRWPQSAFWQRRTLLDQAQELAVPA